MEIEQKWLGLKPYILIEINMSDEEPADDEDLGFVFDIKLGGGVDEEKAYLFTELALQAMQENGWESEEYAADKAAEARGE